MGELLPQPAINNLSADDQEHAYVPPCPVCGGITEPANEVRPASMYACSECSTTVFVPPGAWEVARAKRVMRWRTKTP